MTQTATGAIHLEDFISAVQALKKPRVGPMAKTGRSNEFCLETFWDLVRRLTMTEECLREHINFREDTYARNLVVLTPRFEMLLLCWRPGQNSRIHDHMDSFSVVKVIRGTLTNHLYERLDDGSKPGWCDLRKIRADLVAPGEYASLDLGGVHMMENDPNSGEDLVTLHFYAEPLREIHVFKPEEHKVDIARMRYSLEDRI
ncbi:cysteine dioxygenase family protein [bacterium]|nr:cysteine dioxygenase family protein [bacterium]